MTRPTALLQTPAAREWRWRAKPALFRIMACMIRDARLCLGPDCDGLLNYCDDDAPAAVSGHQQHPGAASINSDQPEPSEAAHGRQVVLPRLS